MVDFVRSGRLLSSAMISLSSNSAKYEVTTLCYKTAWALLIGFKNLSCHSSGEVVIHIMDDGQRCIVRVDSASLELYSANVPGLRINFGEFDFQHSVRGPVAYIFFRAFVQQPSIDLKIYNHG